MKKLKASRFPEYAVFALFAAAYVVISVFHEPWFDEAQAWQIAKCASLREILFVLPHYEGHPPLWHLILTIPAKLGVPYEIGLKSVGFLFSMASIYLIVFRSPFPRFVKLLLPFNYFIFYQYGVIVRPYGMMIFFMLLLAREFPCRNEKPLRFVGILMLLCLSHSYGIVIAGGIAVCLLWDMFEEKGASRFFGEFFRDRRIWALAALLLLALLLIAEIMPDEEALLASENATNSFFKCLWMTVFSMLPESLFTSMNWSIMDTYLLQTAEIPVTNLILAGIVGTLSWFVIFCCSSKKSFRYFAIPYLFFAVFCAAVYLTAHHLGVSLGIFMFWLWLTFSDEDKFANWKAFRAKLSDLDAKVSYRAFIGFAVLCLLFPVFWSVTASVNDIRSNYSHGREVAQFLKSTGLEDRLVFKSWTPVKKNGKRRQMLFCTADSAVLAYFDRNIYANTNGGDTQKAYTIHVSTTPELVEQEYERWREIGIPEVLVDFADVKAVYGDEISISDYSPVFVAPAIKIYKSNVSSYAVPVYLRNDLLDDYDVEVQDISNRSDLFIGYFEAPKKTEEAEG